MTLLAPAFLVGAALAALAVVALHFLARRRPPAGMLPTARFVPDRAVRATSRAPRPTDLALLVLRVLVVLLLGAAFAGLAREPRRAPAARVVVVDRSRGVRDSVALREGALAEWRPGDEVVLVDAAAVRLDPSTAADSLRALAPVAARGSLSAGLVAAQRAAARLARRADRVEVVLLSPFAGESLDSATLLVRRSWPGVVRTVRLPHRAPEPAPRIALRAGADDPLAASVALLGLAARRETESTVRLVRRAPGAADSGWLAEGRERVLVLWPADESTLGRRERIDTIGGVAARGAVVVAPFERRFDPGEGRVVARWADGAPAAAERPLAAGCVRDVAVPVTGRGDLAMRPEMLALVRALAAPCGGPADLAPLPDSIVAAIASGGHVSDAATSGATLARTVTGAFAGPGRSPLAPWLLGAALLLALAEPLLRRQSGPAGSGR
jgi:hypothetical protein